jgi:hypothetical protein
VAISSSVALQGPTRQSAEAAAHELTWLKRDVVLSIVCVGVFMNTLDSGIIEILNPVFVSQYHLDLSQEYWIECRTRSRSSACCWQPATWETAWDARTCSSAA